MPTDGRSGPAIPLARWADRQLKAMAREHGLPALAALEGATLMGERGANGGYTINGPVSAGLGGSRLLPTRDGQWFALTLIRAEDRELLPALFGDPDIAIHDQQAIADAVRRHDCADLVERGRALGLPVASADEVPASPPIDVMTRGLHRSRPAGHRPLVIDLSAIWAGPLAGHLFWQAGMEVVKVESPTRPDLIRRDDPATFDLINQGKANVLVDFASDSEKAALVALIRRADMVIESSRPRALRHLGIDAEALVREVPGLVWLSVTGHGASGEPANWVGIGNDCGVAGGLSRAMAELTGTMGYVGDAIADPLTGITAAREGLRALASGEAQRIGLSMSAITAMALAEERAFDRAAIDAELRAWAAALGSPFPPIVPRVLQAEVRPAGGDNGRYLEPAHPLPLPPAGGSRDLAACCLVAAGWVTGEEQAPQLIRNAEVWGHGLADVRIEAGLIAEIGTLPPLPGEAVHDACGGALLPGLHDHHIHLAATAVRRTSVPCGPPEVLDEAALARALARPGTGWIRGIGFHESVTGGKLPDRQTLDRIVPDRPLRIQHRTGRMWLLNSAAQDELLRCAAAPPGLNQQTGRLFDEDAWLQQALGGTPPDLAALSQELARCGITGVTDMSPRNGAVMAAHFAAQVDSGALAQRLVLAGAPELANVRAGQWRLGPLKLHLHEAAVPDFDASVDYLSAGRAQGRPVAIHCVTEVELVFAIALIEECGAMRGDRIEHASVAPPALVARMAALGVHVCVQPHFIAERGDRYLADVEPHHHDDLYRLRSLRDAGIALAGGSDAPYGSIDPWAALRAAVRRTTSGGRVIGGEEALTPEQALSLYLADPLDLTRQRRIAPGEPADLCLLDRPWSEARERLDVRDVSAVWARNRPLRHRQ